MKQNIFKFSIQKKAEEKENNLKHLSPTSITTLNVNSSPKKLHLRDIDINTESL